MARLILWLAWFVLLTASSSSAAPQYATITGVLRKPSGAPCVSCTVYFRVPHTQVVGGTTFPHGQITEAVADASGNLPAGVQLARTLTVTVQIGSDQPKLCTIANAPIVDIATCIGSVPPAPDINAIPGILAPMKGGTGTGVIASCDDDSEKVATDASGVFFCDSNPGGGGGGGGAPVDATYITRTANTTLTSEFAMGTLASGLVHNTTTTGTPTIYAGTACTNQFVRSLNSSGTATCASVVLGTDTTGNYAGSSSPGGAATDLACSNCVALGPETTGGYAGSSSEGGSATSAVQLDDGDYGDISSASGVLSIDTGVVGADELASTTVTPGSYGSATASGTFTVDADGRLTAASSTTITPAFSSITGATNTTAAMIVGTGASLSASGSGTIAATTATALAANPTDCASNQYAHTIAASGNLTCSQVGFSQLSGTATDAQIPNNITIDLAATATALAANGANCSSGQAAGGVDAAGAAEACIDPIVNLGTDPAGTLPIANGGTGQTTASAAFNALAPTTTAGDIIYRDGSGNVRLGIGANGTGLVSDGSAPTWTNVATQAEFDQLSEGRLWMGSGADARTEYSIPVGRDIRTTDAGAGCAGATDDSGAIAEALSEGGTAWIPAGCRARIDSTVTLASGQRIICAPGAILSSGSSLSGAMLQASGAVGVSVEGCTLNADQVKVDLIRFVSSSDDAHLRALRLYWNLDGDAANHNTTAFDFIELNCAATAASKAGCSILDVHIVGSANDGQDDTGISLKGAGASFGAGTNVAISRVTVVSTGAAALNSSGGVVLNLQDIVAFDCRDTCVVGNYAQSNVSGIHIFPNATDVGVGGFGVDVETSNSFWSTVNLPDPLNSGHNRFRATGGGFTLNGAYAVDGITLFTTSATERLQSARLFNITMSATQCDTWGDSCILIENPDDVIISALTIFGAFGSAGGDGIRFNNKHTGGAEMQQLRINNSMLAFGGHSTGVESGIRFTSVGSATGYLDFSIENVTFGDRGATALNHGVVVDTITSAAAFAGKIVDSDFVNTTNAVSGFPAASEIGAMGNVALPSARDGSSTNTTLGAGFTLTASRDVLYVDATANRTSSATTAINDGTFDRQVFLIVNADSGAETITISNGANTDLGANCTLNPGGTLQVMWLQSRSDWVSLGCNAN